jgi:hypothetical protein
VPFLFNAMKENMKYCLFILVGLVAGCAQLQHGQIQPVVLKSAKESIYFTTCSGAVEDWASCYAKARNTCSDGYKITEQNENGNGGFRDITFKCK